MIKKTTFFCVLYQQRLFFPLTVRKSFKFRARPASSTSLSLSQLQTDFLCSLTSICGSTRSDPVHSLFCSQDYFFPHLGSSSLLHFLLLFRIPSTTLLPGISSCFRIWVLILLSVGYRSRGVRAFVATVLRSPHSDFGNWGLFFFGFEVLGVFN